MSLYVSGRNKIGIPTFPILEEKWINRVQRKLTQKKEKIQISKEVNSNELKRMKEKNEREKEEQKESENSLKKGKQTIAQ